MDDKKCASCGKEFLSMPFVCKFCTISFCIDHRLPESHNCTGLTLYKERQLESLKQGRPEKPLEYFHEKWRRPKYRVFYYLLLVSITLMAIFVMSRILA